MASVAVGSTSLGANTLVAAVAGKKIRIRSIFLLAAADVSVYLKSSGGTAIIGTSDVPMALSVNGGFVLNFNDGPEGWGQTVAGEALQVNLSAAVGVSGTLQYELTPIV